MPHVELSLSEPLVPQQRPPADREPATAPVTNLDHWVAAVAVAAEPCLIIDSDAVILAASASCGELLGIGDPAAVEGQFLLGGPLRLVDFTAARVELTLAESDKIPPLLALSSARLARGLLRVQCGPTEADIRTVDAIATPLWEESTVAGSLTFFSEV